MTNDTGARCDEHVGEVFPPRCADCDTAAAEEAAWLRSWRENEPRRSPQTPTTNNLENG